MSDIKCPHCGQSYPVRSLKDHEMLVNSEGIPAIACINCHWQVPLLDFVKEREQKKLLERIKALEKELPIPNLKGDR